MPGHTEAAHEKRPPARVPRCASPWWQRASCHVLACGQTRVLSGEASVLPSAHFLVPMLADLRVVQSRLCGLGTRPPGPGLQVPAHVCVFVRVHMCMSARVHMWVCAHVDVCAHGHVCMFVCVHVHGHVSMCMCACLHVFVHVHVRMRAHLHTCVCACARVHVPAYAPSWPGLARSASPRACTCVFVGVHVCTCVLVCAHTCVCMYGKLSTEL